MILMKWYVINMLKKVDKPLIIISIILFIFGLIMILSASSMESYMRYGASPYYYFLKQAIFLVGGLVIFLFTIFIPTKIYKKLAWPLIIITIISLIGLVIYGHVANNAASWYDIGIIKLQPSEIAKITLIIFMASYYDKNKNKLNNKLILILPLVIGVIITLLIAIQPDMGTAFIVFALLLSIFYSVPMKKGERNIITKLIILILLLFGAIMLVTKGTILRDYQLDRFNFKDPCDRYKEKTGYQLCNSFIAFKNGGLTGQGIGKSTQKYLYLPESYTDFIFPIIVEEWGLIVGAVIIILLFLLLFRIFKIARNAKNLRNSLLAFGIFVYIFLHIVINLSGVMGIIPLTGVPLPFLSYGGSYCISLMFALALVSRISIENNSK